jgi:hypothetical protein
MINSYDEFVKEGLFNFHSKYLNNEQGLTIFEDMKIDFINSNKDLKKISITNRNNKFCDFRYYFKDNSQKNVYIYNNYREFFFSTHPHRNEYFYISKSVGKKIVNYFIDEYIKQYPQFKKSNYLTPWNLDVFKKYGKPAVGTVHEYSANGESCHIMVFDEKKRDEIRKFIKTHGAIFGKSKDGETIMYYFDIQKTNSDIDPYGEEEDYFSDDILKHITSTTYDELSDEQEKLLKNLR